MKQRKLTLPKISEISPWEQSKTDLYNQTIMTIVSRDYSYDKTHQSEQIIHQLLPYFEHQQKKSVDKTFQTKKSANVSTKKTRVKKVFVDVPPQQIGKNNPEVDALKSKFFQDCSNYALLTWITEKVSQQLSTFKKQQNRRKMECLLPLLSPQKYSNSLKLEQYLRDNKKSLVNEIRFLHS